MNASIINATKVAILAGLVAVIGTLWLANLGQTEPVEAAFSQPDPCLESETPVDATLAQREDALAGVQAYSYWKKICGPSEYVERYRCQWTYTATATGSSREQVCAWRTYRIRPCRWVLFYR